LNCFKQRIIKDHDDLVLLSTMNELVFGVVQLTCLHTQCPNFPWGNYLLSDLTPVVFQGYFYQGAPLFLTSALKIFFLNNMMMVHFSLLLLVKDIQFNNK
jgi:hypothetical protein